MLAKFFNWFCIGGILVAIDMFCTKIKEGKACIVEGLTNDDIAKGAMVIFCCVFVLMFMFSP